MKANSVVRTALGSAVLAASLAACVGGEDLAETGIVSNDASPSGVVTVEAGESLAVRASASAKYASVVAHAWTVSQVGGAPSDVRPSVVDASCAGASTSPGNPADSQKGMLSRDGTSECRTVLVVPVDTPSSEWVIENVARSASGSASDRFTLKVRGLVQRESGFALNVPTLPMLFTSGQTVQLAASHSVNEGITLDGPVRWEWSQVSGPTVAVAGAQTREMAFYAREAGEYVFKVTAVAPYAGKSLERSGAVVAIVQPPEVPLTYDVSAGGLQAVEVDKIATLKGTVTGTVPPEQLSYRWRQVGGPAVTIYGDESLWAQFTPRQAGDYEFELQVTRSGPSTTVKASRTKVSAYEPQRAFFTVSAGAAQVVEPGAVVQLRAQVAVGEPGANLSYSWVQRTGPAVVLSAANSLNTSFVAAEPGSYEFDFTATDGTVSKTDTAVVVVKAPSTAFTVSAGDLQVSAVGVPVTLSGGVFPRIEPQQLVINWRQVGGPAVELANPNTWTPQFLPTQKGDYAFELQVSRVGDFSSMQSSRTMVAVYAPSDAPTDPFFAVSAGDAQIVRMDKPVFLLGTVVAATTEPLNAAFEWVQLAGPAQVVLSNAQNRRASFLAYEPGLYVFELTVTVGNTTKTATTTVQVLLPAEDEAP